MSRRKKRHTHTRHGAATVVPVPGPPPSKPRIAAAHRRATLAKAGTVCLAIVGFGAAFAFSRVTYAGHSKKPLHPLAAPPRYVRIVRQNLLQAGIVAPAQAPPGAATSSS
jgi:hypothetical protein